jgi:hypothetical protein
MIDGQRERRGNDDELQGYSSTLAILLLGKLSSSQSSGGAIMMTNAASCGTSPKELRNE